MHLRFEPLSYERLPEALELIKIAFPDNFSHVAEVYNISLKNDKKDPYWETRMILEYWTVIDSETDRVVALTGFYQLTEHSKDEIWLGWFCVDPLERGKGIGRKTLQWTIDEARKRGYAFFRLWTTTSPDEEIAQKLYDSVGLNIYKEEPDEKSGYTKMFREIRL